jgi:hypothetical protein
VSPVGTWQLKVSDPQEIAVTVEFFADGTFTIAPHNCGFIDGTYAMTTRQDRTIETRSTASAITCASSGESPSATVIRAALAIANSPTGLTLVDAENLRFDDGRDHIWDFERTASEASKGPMRPTSTS